MEADFPLASDGADQFGGPDRAYRLGVLTRVSSAKLAAFADVINAVNDDDIELLGELGVEADPVSTGGRTAKEQRVIAGFEEIERFVEEHGRLPEHGESRDIFERLYAVRLDQIRASGECRGILEGLDSRGLLGPDTEPQANGVEESPADEALLAALGVQQDLLRAVC